MIPACYFDTPIGRNLRARQNPTIIEVQQSLTMHEARAMLERFERATGRRALIVDGGARVSNG